MKKSPIPLHIDKARRCISARVEVVVVRIGVDACQWQCDETYHSRVNKRGPIVAIFKQGQDERHGGRAQQDQNQLVLELFENEFP